MLLFQLPFKLPPAIINLWNTLYGPQAGRDKVWHILMTVCVFMLFFKNYRRFGGISFIFLLICMLLWNWMQDAYYQFTPH